METSVTMASASGTVRQVEGDCIEQQCRKTAENKKPFDLSGQLTLSRFKILNSFYCFILSRLTGLNFLQKKYKNIKSSGRRGKQYINYLISILNIRSKVTFKCAGEAVPSTGGTVIMSNHPYGVTDGLLLLQFVLRYRSDVKIMINDAISDISEFDDLVITVNPYGGKTSQKDNVRQMRECHKWIKAGGCLVVFPAGEVSHYQPRKRAICDSKWSAHVARLVQNTEAKVVPVFFSGHNGLFFQMAGLVSPWLRTFLLGRAFINTWGKTISFVVGETISPKAYRKVSNVDELAKFFRLQTYILNSVDYISPAQVKLKPESVTVANDEQICDELIDAIDSDLLIAEVGALPEKNHLITSSDLSVYFATAKQIPWLIQEIGRLREETFRSVGEGTGKAFDLDRYDDYYTHLFIWNNKEQELLGAYRVAEVSKIIADQGVTGLYTHSLFKFKSELFSDLSPALELGRSFVRNKYQKSYAPLLMLWKGIATYMARETDCSVLFGPVSISNEYRNETQKMLMDYLRVNNPYPERSKIIKPRNPFKLKNKVGWRYSELNGIKDVELLSHLVSKLEDDSKGVPILLKQYLKLGGYVLSFNVDESFSDVLDCMIVVDFKKNDFKTLQRYMGSSLATDFSAKQRQGETAVKKVS